MPNKKTIFIIAGEVSGDVLGANIMRELPGFNFVGVGGQNMCDAGLKSIFPMSDLAVMGIVEVLANARTLKRRIRDTIQKIIDTRPCLVLTIDSPGFARSVIDGLKKSRAGRDLIRDGMRFYHVVAPQVWAWRPGRAKKYAKTFDKLYAFFDFEKPYFTKYGLDTVAVGHPISDGLDKYKKTVKDEKIITLVPGSRINEVKKLLPLFHKTVDMLYNCGYRGYKFVIPTVETTEKYIKQDIKNWRIKPTLVCADERYSVYANTYIAIVASGTVSAELAIMHIPTIVVYKMNPLTVLLAHILLKIKWVSLVNILMDKSIFPELLGKKANPCAVVDSLQQLTLPSIRDAMVAELTKADNKWAPGGKKPAYLIAEDIIKSL